MLKKLLPNKILSLQSKTFNSLVILLIIVFVIGIIYSLLLSPPDYIQGDSVRIMYVHVPSSFIALGSFGLIGSFSIFNLIFKIKFLTLIAKSLAPVGCVFSIISIVTGSLWGKPTWGVWWVWDARLTSMLVLIIFYLVISLGAGRKKNSQAKEIKNYLFGVRILIIIISIVFCILWFFL